MVSNLWIRNKDLDAVGELLICPVMNKSTILDHLSKIQQTLAHRWLM